VLRLSYDGHGIPDLPDLARRDAVTLLGAPLDHVLDAAIVPWVRPAPAHAGSPTHAVDGMRRIGEAENGTGLASVVAAAEREAGRLLDERAAHDEAAPD
jgi:oxygen-dependent protoporphyrinogen oxidase